MLSVSESLLFVIGALDAPDTFVPPEVSIGGFGKMIGGKMCPFGLTPLAAPPNAPVLSRMSTPSANLNCRSVFS